MFIIRQRQNPVAMYRLCAAKLPDRKIYLSSNRTAYRQVQFKITPEEVTLGPKVWVPNIGIIVEMVAYQVRF